MENAKDSLFLELFGLKAGAHGRFAIVAVLLALLVAGAGLVAARALSLG
jgi:hypothetical protein